MADIKISNNLNSINKVINFIKSQFRPKFIKIYLFVDCMNYLKSIKCYTIDVDIEIMNQPQLNLTRFQKYLMHLLVREKNEIKNYLKTKGKDAVI